MSHFEIPISTKKRRSQKMWGYSLIVASLILLASLFLYDEEEGNTLRMLRIIAMANAFFSGISYLRKSRRSYFLNITDTNIEWYHPYFDKPRLVDWKEVTWIKKEKNNNISFFRQSSFSDILPLKEYTHDAQQNILQLLETIAIKKQIQLVNFSEAA